MTQPDTAAPTVLVRHIWAPSWIAPLLWCRGPLTLSHKRPDALCSGSFASLPDFMSQAHWEITITDLHGLYSPHCRLIWIHTDFIHVYSYICNWTQLLAGAISNVYFALWLMRQDVTVEGKRVKVNVATRGDVDEICWLNMKEKVVSWDGQMECRKYYEFSRKVQWKLLFINGHHLWKKVLHFLRHIVFDNHFSLKSCA